MSLKLPSGPLILGRGGGLQIKSGGAAAFVPANYGTVALDFDATAITGKVDGDAISQWNDGSTNAKHATQATGSKQPLYKTNIQNGKPVVRFDGTDDNIATTGISLVQPTTVFAVLIFRTAFAGGTPSAFDTKFTNFALLFSRRSSTNMSIYAGNALVGGNTTPEAWHTYSGIFNAASSQLWADGVSLGTGNAGTTTCVDFNMGSVGGGGSYAAVDIGRILIYNGSLSNGNRQAVEAALKTIWGTP